MRTEPGELKAHQGYKSGLGTGVVETVGATWSGVWGEGHQRAVGGGVEGDVLSFASQKGSRKGSRESR